MPIFAWAAGKLILIGGYAVVYGGLVAGAVLTVYATVKVGQGIGDAMVGGTESSRAAREAADASPAELDRLQTEYIEGQLKQHRGIAQAVQQTPQLVSGLQDLTRRARRAGGEDLTDRDILGDPIDGLTQPWTTPGIGHNDSSIQLAFEPVGSAKVGAAAQLTLTIKGLDAASEVVFSVIEGEGKLARATLQASPGKSTSDCDAIGRDLVCGNTVTPGKAGALQVEATVQKASTRLRFTVSGEPAVQETRCPSQVLEPGKSYRVTLKTSKGDVVVRLLNASAPQTANSFACLAKSGFFVNQTFYRVDPGFVITTGDPTRTGDGDAGYGTPLEASSVRNTRGTVSVGARPSGTVGSQWFINLVDNRHLDFDNPRPDKYYPFATVVSGLDVVDAIAAGPAGAVTILQATLTVE